MSCWWLSWWWLSQSWVLSHELRCEKRPGLRCKTSQYQVNGHMWEGVSSAWTAQEGMSRLYFRWLIPGVSHHLWSAIVIHSRWPPLEVEVPGIVSALYSKHCAVQFVFECWDAHRRITWSEVHWGSDVVPSVILFLLRWFLRFFAISINLTKAWLG